MASGFFPLQTFKNNYEKLKFTVLLFGRIHTISTGEKRLPLNTRITTQKTPFDLIRVRRIVIICSWLVYTLPSIPFMFP